MRGPDMSVQTAPTPMSTTSNGSRDDRIELHRRTVDKLLIAFGVIAAMVLAAVGGLLIWGSTFAGDYVQDELESQNIFFPDEASLVEEGRDDLVQYADQQVTTGQEAEAYASFIDGHLQGIADGQTYSQIDDRGAAQAVVDAEEAGASPEEIAELQATADELRGQRDSLFRGETLRGLLLSTYAWSTVGRIAAIAAWVAFVGAAVMVALVVAGVFHVKRSKA